MNHHRNLFSQAFLQHAQMRCCLMFGYQSIYLVFRQRSKDFDIAFRIRVAYIQPELVEFIRRSISRIEPYIARFRLTEFTTIGFRNQRASQCISLSPIGAADQLGAGSNIAPLVGTTHL